MNPTNQPVSFYGDNSRNTDAALLAAIATKQPYEYDYAGMIGAGGICDLREEVKDVGANVREAVKDAESQIRSDVRQEGQEAVSATKDAECRLMNKLGDVECAVTKEVMETKFALTREILETKHTLGKDILRSEYENKLAIQAAIKEINANAQHNAERTQDKIDHGFEEVNEKLCECCGEAAVVATRQDGLLNLLVDALNVK